MTSLSSTPAQRSPETGDRSMGGSRCGCRRTWSRPSAPATGSTADRRAVISDPAPVPVRVPRKELLARLRQRVCELCEAGTTVAVHQVAALRELGKPGPDQPAWAALMAKIRRKTLIVCAPCHDWIH